MFKSMVFLIMAVVILDLMMRLAKNKKINSFKLLRFTAFYYGMTSLIVFSINYRPTVTEFYKGYFKAITYGYFGIDEFKLDGKSLHPEYFDYYNKATDYGLSKLMVDRNLISLCLYSFSWIMYGVFYTTQVSRFFNSLRFVIGTAFFYDFLMSMIYQLLNSQVTKLETPYLIFNDQISKLILIISFVEQMYMLYIGLFSPGNISSVNNITEQVENSE
jgi:hypothetical protein